MITFEIKTPSNLGRLTRALMMFPQLMERAGRSAVRRTLKGGRRDAGQKIAQRYTIQSSAVTKTIKNKVNGLTGEMTSRGSRFPLPRFRHVPKKRINPQPAQGIFVQNVKGEGGNLFHAWSMYKGGIYQRVGAERFPIRTFTGPSAPGMLSSKPVSSFIVNKLQERLGINLEHEANAVMSGFL
jgi:hypothetical protein